MSRRSDRLVNRMLLLLLLMVFYALKTAYAKPLYAPSEELAQTVGTDALQTGEEDVPMVMVHNNNFDMMMPDSIALPSMAYQDFEKFYDPQMVDTNNEYSMDETQFLKNTPVREPQPLSDEERVARATLESTNVHYERKKQKKLKKGSTKPRQGVNPWEQFDYDLYSVYPGDSKKSSAFEG